MARPQKLAARAKGSAVRLLGRTDGMLNLSGHVALA